MHYSAYSKAASRADASDIQRIRSNIAGSRYTVSTTHIYSTSRNRSRSRRTGRTRDVHRVGRNSAGSIHAIAAHHGGIEATSIIDCLVQAADAVSAARPGARRENVESYIKRLQRLEEIAREFEGVSESFAIQAGREVRVLVKPEAISDDEMPFLAREICKKIENELDYPGQIKVNVIRESRASEYAK